MEHCEKRKIILKIKPYWAQKPFQVIATTTTPYLQLKLLNLKDNQDIGDHAVTMLQDCRNILEFHLEGCNVSSFVTGTAIS